MMTTLNKSVSNTMYILIVAALICFSSPMCGSFPVNICGDQHISNTSGIIALETLIEDTLNCTWIVTPPHKYITTFNIINVDLGKCTERNKLSISWSNGAHNFCEDTALPKLISLRQPRLVINIQSDESKAKVWLQFKTRSHDECTDFDFQCTDKRKCFNRGNWCDGIFDCEDHSDEVSCGLCTKNLVPCSNMAFECFSAETERCNGIIDCIHGEDEIGCNPKCNTSIACENQDQCIPPKLLCDGKNDCKTGMDEDKCKSLYCSYRNFSPEYNEKCDQYGPFDSLRSVVAGVLTIIIALLIIFGALVWRWYHGRRDIEGLIADMPEFPLPPFEGPGEEHTDSPRERFSQRDFAVGGEIYEAYAQTRRRISSEIRPKTKKLLHLPMSAPSTKPNSPDLARNRSAASLIGGTCLSRNNTIENVIEDFYDEDDFPITVKYVNEAFSDDKSQKDNEESRKFVGFKKLFRKKRVRSADGYDRARADCDFSIFSVNQNTHR